MHAMGKEDPPWLISRDISLPQGMIKHFISFCLYCTAIVFMEGIALVRGIYTFLLLFLAHLLPWLIIGVLCTILLTLQF